MQAEARHLLAVRRDRPAASSAPSSVSSVARLAIGGIGRRIEPGELRRIGVPQQASSSASGARSAARISGVVKRGKRALLGLGPQPVADARLQPSGAAAALIGRGLRDPHGLEPRHAAARLEARHPHEAAIDDDADALDGEAGLGDRGRQHDLALARRRRQQRRVLRLLREVAVERRDADIGIEPALAEQPLDAADLAGAGQEDEEAALSSRERAADRGDDIALEAPAGGRSR